MSRCWVLDIWTVGKQDFKLIVFKGKERKSLFFKKGRSRGGAKVLSQRCRQMLRYPRHQLYLKHLEATDGDNCHQITQVDTAVDEHWGQTNLSRVQGIPNEHPHPFLTLGQWSLTCEEAEAKTAWEEANYRRILVWDGYLTVLDAVSFYSGSFLYDAIAFF